MKGDTVLDFAVFQLTPTRTRCELLISSKGVSEKLASGLLKPFLAHLRAAEEQIAVGGYSIRLEPSGDDGKQNNNSSNRASWFTKGTMQRFVRFVSTPEVLERVSAVESELIQLEEELSSYTNEGDDQQSVCGSIITNPAAGRFGSRTNKARKDSLDELEADGNGNESSKCRLIKAMEARHAMLQREQGMAFARAVAAGFDMDHLPDLLSFAECFGAARLSEACHKFAALCKKQQEGGLWLDEMELVAAEGGAFSYSETTGGITIAPAGLDPLITTKKSEEDSNLPDPEASSRSEHLRRQSSGYLSDQPGYPQQMPGMQMPGYPWMMDPRFIPQMPQNPYMNGGFPPYWGAGPPPPGFNNKVESNGRGEEDEEESPPGKKKSSRKLASPSRRRSGSPLKKLQVGGRSGKRSGMVLIRNINYITGTGANKNKSGAGADESEESSEFETSSEFERGNQSKMINGKPRKGSRRKSSSAAAPEVSSEGSHASTSGETKRTTHDDQSVMFTVPQRASMYSGDGSYSFDSESLPPGSRNEPDLGGDDSFFLNNGERANGVKGFNQLGVESEGGGYMRSKDGMLLPHRAQAGRIGFRSQDSELSHKNPPAGSSDRENSNIDDCFIIPARTGLSEAAPGIDEAEQVRAGEERSSREAPVAEDMFIVPSSRRVEETRRAVELEMPGELLNFVEGKKVEAAKFEPEEVWMIPERTKESMEKRWNDVDFDMEVMAAIQSKPEPEVEEEPAPEEFYEQYHEQRDAKILKEPVSKRAEREAKMRSLQETLDTRRAEMSSRFKATRSSILKTKKEKEEAERKRIEEIAAERRNRIAARSGGGSSSSRASSTVQRPGGPSVLRPGSGSRALSSTPTNRDSSQLKKPTPVSSRASSVARSVPSLAEFRKENTKPAASRQPTTITKGRIPGALTPDPKKGAPPSGGAADDKKPAAASRKSIASLRELKKPETTPAKSSKIEPSNPARKPEDMKSVQVMTGQGQAPARASAPGNDLARVAAALDEIQLPAPHALTPPHGLLNSSSASNLQQQQLPSTEVEAGHHRHRSGVEVLEEHPVEVLKEAEQGVGVSSEPQVVKANGVYRGRGQGKEEACEKVLVESREAAEPELSAGAAAARQQARDSNSKGIKKLLMFGRRSRSSGSTGGDGGAGSLKVGAESGEAGANNKLKDNFSTSSIPAPPEDFKLREDRISSSSSIKAPRSFFSFSSFRSKEGRVR